MWDGMCSACGTHGRDRRVLARRLQAARRHLRVVVAVDQVVDHSRVVRVRGVEGLEDLGGARRVLEGGVGGRVRGEQRERVEARDLDVPGVLGEEPLHGLFVGQGSSGVLGPPGEPVAGLAGFARARRGGVRRRVGVVGREGRDQAALDVAPAPGRPGALDRLPAGRALVRGGRRPDRVPEGHGDTPVRQGAARLLRRDLAEDAPRLVVEEGMEQRRGALDPGLGVRAAGGARACTRADGAQVAEPGRWREASDTPRAARGAAASATGAEQNVTRHARERGLHVDLLSLRWARSGGHHSAVGGR